MMNENFKLVWKFNFSQGLVEEKVERLYKAGIGKRFGTGES